MKKELSVAEKAVAMGMVKNRFFIMVHIGGFMILLTAVSPLYAAHMIPATLMTVLAVVFEKYSGTQVIHRRIMVIIVLLLSIWIGANTTFQWFPVPAEVTAITFPPVTVTPKMTLSFGFVGHVIVLVAAIEALCGLKYFKD